MRRGIAHDHTPSVVRGGERKEDRSKYAKKFELTPYRMFFVLCFVLVCLIYAYILIPDGDGDSVSDTFSRLMRRTDEKATDQAKKELAELRAAQQREAELHEEAKLQPKKLYGTIPDYDAHTKKIALQSFDRLNPTYDVDTNSRELERLLASGVQYDAILVVGSEFNTPNLEWLVPLVRDYKGVIKTSSVQRTLSKERHYVHMQDWTAFEDNRMPWKNRIMWIAQLTPSIQNIESHPYFVQQRELSADFSILVVFSSRECYTATKHAESQFAKVYFYQYHCTVGKEEMKMYMRNPQFADLFDYTSELCTNRHVIWRGKQEAMLNAIPGVTAVQIGHEQLDVAAPRSLLPAHLAPSDKNSKERAEPSKPPDYPGYTYAPKMNLTLETFHERNPLWRLSKHWNEIDWKQYDSVVVTGPQRSGTTFVSQALATWLDFTFLDEISFYWHWWERFEKLERYHTVIQAPAISGEMHNLAPLPGNRTLLIFLVRECTEVSRSQERANITSKSDWTCLEGLKEMQKYKFNAELKEAQGVVSIELNVQSQCSFKQYWWLDYQRQQVLRKSSLQNMKTGIVDIAEIRYDSFEEHPMWLEKKKREEFTIKQTTLAGDRP